MAVTVVAVSGSNRSTTGCDGLVAQPASRTKHKQQRVERAAAILQSFTCDLGHPVLKRGPIEPKV
jgi:hypothetical protein